MCGICGVFDLKKQNRINQIILQKMANKIQHRGPDDIGFYIKDNIGLGFTRLSIIDLNGGMQPISNENNSVILVCNGEIFNYKELKKDLISKGHLFRTSTDVEVLIHLYEEYEYDFINKLNGQFAFAIYDLRKNQLFCGRDHVGILPFYYTLTDDNLFIFASEIKGILEHPSVKREVDLVGLDQILSFPGLINEQTLFKNIKSLPSGNFLCVSFEEDLQIKEYWDLVYPKTNETCYSENDEYYIDRLDDIITKAVKYRLNADVPVGFYLSGGLDSSIIASKIKAVDPQSRRHSFSVDFIQENMSEGKYQKIVADHVNSIHHNRLFDTRDIVKYLPKVIYHSESPLKETYNTASMALSETVRKQNIKVVLTGEGADELFGGYVGYKFDKMRQHKKQDITEQLLLEKKMRKQLWGDENFFYEKDYKDYENKKRQLYSHKINECYENINCFNRDIINKERIHNIDLLHKRSYIDFKVRLTEHLLGDHGDRMAYSNSIEARYPFLDKDLIEFATKIPPRLKLNGFIEKYILKKIAESLIPEEIINRPKFSFVAPGSSKILKQNHEFINDMLSYQQIKRQGYFNPDKIEALKKQYLSKDFKLNLPFDEDFLIIVITFNIFLEKFNMPNK